MDQKKKIVKLPDKLKIYQTDKKNEILFFSFIHFQSVTMTVQNIILFNSIFFLFPVWFYLALKLVSYDCFNLFSMSKINDFFSI